MVVLTGIKISFPDNIVQLGYALRQQAVKKYKHFFKTFVRKKEPR